VKTPFAHRLLLASLLAASVFGAVCLAFLCDDAYITFRYVANAHAGHGLVWNPAPFLPVEGYTGFLWALVLWATWSWFGVEPPDAANVLSIVCGVGQFLLLALAASRLRRIDGSRAPAVVGFVALAVVVGNRTFLQWQTSGLETALFNFAFVGWVLLAFRGRRDASWLAWWSAAASAAALTRPDGLLFVSITFGVGVLQALGAGGRSERLRRSLGLAPLLATAAHVLWRRATYGEWLPNTYYAKVTGLWPEAGLRYFACFCVEHGVWLWSPLCLLWLLVEWRRGARPLALLREQLPAVAAVGAVTFHFVYYTVAVGGDHFEYRVYSHLVPLGVLAAAAMAARLWSQPAWPVAALLLLGLASSVGWVHLWATRDMPVTGFRPVAERLPDLVSPLTRWFDRQQAWLRFRMIGLRCNHHALFLAEQRQTFRARMPVQGASDAFPAYSTGAVGLVGWCLPDAVIVDMHGLNDWVVARTPIRSYGPPPSPEQIRAMIQGAGSCADGWLDRASLERVLRAAQPPGADAAGPEYLASVFLAIYGRQRPGHLSLDEAAAIGESLAGARSMAHERLPPPGYVEELAPNVVVRDGVATAKPRERPLTAARIEAFEARWREIVRREFARR
jgi:arabinofuranosyltransferase